jgi:ferrous iron transport protein B
MSCHCESKYKLPVCEDDGKIHYRIALAGNPNVGKSVIFNKLSGLSQVIGNWPGKTVSKAEGRALWGDYVFDMVDLPGIYSLSTYSLEEIVSREYIVKEHPDYVINVIDSNHLERNLYFTLQLLMLDRPMIVSLNQFDLLKTRGYDIDIEKLSSLLGVLAVPTVAVHNRGVHELLEEIIRRHKSQEVVIPKQIEFGKEVEQAIQELIQAYQEERLSQYPARFACIKILENDAEIIKDLGLSESGKGAKIIKLAKEKREKLEGIHGEKITTVINAELFLIAHRIAEEVLILKEPTRKQKFTNFIDHLTIHSVWGYIILFGLLIGSYALIFQFGDWFSGVLDDWFEAQTPWAIVNLGGGDSWQFKIIWNGLVAGFIGGVGGVLPYVVPFYFFLEILQDTGYLPRAAYLMDQMMHKIGVHGKTIIPMLLGFGCNVPAVSASMIMENEREKRRSILISSMVPCAAVSTIVMGLVGSYLGLGYALLLYVINFTAIVVIGRIMSKMDGCVQSELIIEFHDFRKPNFNVLLKQTWHRSKEFVVMALPLIIILGVFIQIMLEFNLLDPVNNLIAPLIVGLLGLPVGIGIFFIYGIFRKELNLVLLEIYVLSLNLTMVQYMTPMQMLLFALITMLYVPCAATIVMIRRHEGTKFANQIFWLQMGLAIGVAAVLRWSYELWHFAIPNSSEYGLIVITFIGFFLLIFIFMGIWEKSRSPMPADEQIA